MADVEFPSLNGLNKLEDIIDRVENMRKEIEFNFSSLDRNAVMTSSFAAGQVLITPTAANTPTSIAITFGKEFSNVPIVVCTANTMAPGTVVTGVSATDITKTGCNLWLTRTNTTATGVSWIAADV